MQKPLIAGDGSVLLEITLRCYSGCDYCYKYSLVSPKKPHINFKTLERRLKWIDQNIECDTIYLIGGEPLLHPELIRIIWRVIKMGKTPAIITSGNISTLPHEQRNLEAVADLYEKGLLKIELSFQENRNETGFAKLAAKLAGRYKARRAALRKAEKYEEGDFDLVSTAVVSQAHVGNWDSFIALVNRAMMPLFREGPSDDTIESMKKYFPDYEKHFARFEDSAYFSSTVTSVDSYLGFRVKLRLVGVIGIIECSPGKTFVEKPKGGLCPVMKVSLTDDQVTLPSVTVRHDGDLCFSKPECITVSRGLCNADLHKAETIYSVVRRSLKDVKRQIITDKRNLASSPAQFCQADRDFPKGSEDDGACDSCPFALSCNGCHSHKESW